MMEVFQRTVLRRFDSCAAALEHARGRRKVNGPPIIVEQLQLGAARRWAVVKLRPLDLDSDDGAGWSE